MAAVATSANTATLPDIKVLDKVHEDGLHYIKFPECKDTRTCKVTKEDLTVSEPLTPEKILEKLRIYGGCFVRNYVSEQVCDDILADVEPLLDQYKSPDDVDDFIAPTTERVSGVMVKSKTAAEKFLAHPLNIAVSNAILGKENIFTISENTAISGFSPAQHNSCVTFRIKPGAKNQGLHRDDSVHHNVRKYHDKYDFSAETAVGTVLGLKKATKENGATRFVPGSHLWDHYRLPKEEETVYAELDRGDCFFMLSSCFHGGSANTTKDEERVVCILFMTQGILRQEENIFLGTPIEYFKSLSIDALKALGLQTSQPFCGWYENDDPIYKLKPNSKEYKHRQFGETYHVEQ